MKKETVNIFKEGLNMDLNPIVTPNNVLTDALNATTITFNGDELSLQTDAGNTKIKVPGKDEYVKLSDGFYPLGIKEYGGILYIVSTNNSDIEIGSYPSPDYTGSRTFYGDSLNYNSNSSDFSNKLYKTFAINESDFKSGRYVKFTTISTDFNNVTTNDNSKIYLVKLYHKLDNGFLDLTNDVWEKFLKHKSDTGDTATHWLLSSTFHYFCPTQFKGNLSAQILLNDENLKFQLVNPPILSEHIRDESDEVNFSHDLVFNLDWEDNDNIMITDEDIKYNIIIKDFNDNVITKITTESSINPSYITKENKNVKVTIPFATTNPYTVHDGIRYEIQPIFKVRSNTGWITTTISELPEEFISKYLISGTQLLSEKYTSIFFSLEDSRCTYNGFRDYNIAIMSNMNGWVNLELEPSDIKYVFAKQNILLDDNMYLLGRFIVKNGKPKIVGGNNSEEQTQIDNAITILEQTPGLYENIKTIFENQQIRVVDSSCEELEINVRFNLAFDMMYTNSTNEQRGFIVRFTQGEKDIPYTSVDGRNFIIKIDSSDDLYCYYYFPFSTTGQYKGVDHENQLPFADYNKIVKGSFKINKESLVNEKVYNVAIVTGWRNLNIANNIVQGQYKTSYFYSGTFSQNNKDILIYLKEKNLFNITVENKTVQGWEIENNSIKVKIWRAFETSDINLSNRPTYTISGSLPANKYINLVGDENNYVELGNNDIGYIIMKKTGTISLYSQNF